MTRLNYTGRRRLPQELIEAALNADGDPPNLEISVDLTRFALPDDHEVVVEVYRPQTYQTKRVVVGTVKNPPNGALVPLSDFPTADDVLARVKIVGSVGADEGKIVLVADKIRPRGGEGHGSRRGLLDIRPSDDLGQRLWRLDLGEGPVLLVNRGVGDWNEYARSPNFAALVYSEVLRLIVGWLIDNPPDDPADMSDGAAQWAAFVNQLGVSLEDVDGDDDEARAEAAELAVDEFAQRNRFLDRVKAAHAEDE